MELRALVVAVVAAFAITGTYLIASVLPAGNAQRLVDESFPFVALLVLLVGIVWIIRVKRTYVRHPHHENVIISVVSVIILGLGIVVPSAIVAMRDPQPFLRFTTTSTVIVGSAATFLRVMQVVRRDG